MENIILDEIEDEKSKEGISSSALHYLPRFFLCFGSLFAFLSAFNFFQNLNSYGFIDLLILLLLQVIMPIFFIYYNLVHAFMEIKRKPAVPKFGKKMIAISIAIISWYLLGGFYTLFTDLIYMGINLYTAVFVFGIFCQAIVLSQEIKYYKWHL